MKAADITDEQFLAAMRTVHELRPDSMIGRWDIGFVLGGQDEVVRAISAGHRPRPWPEAVIPEKIVLAKARRLIKRGLITGCTCGCRGDFEIIWPASTSQEPTPREP